MTDESRKNFIAGSGVAHAHEINAMTPTDEQMIASGEYQLIHHHREGLEGQVNYAVVQNGGMPET